MQATANPNMPSTDAKSILLVEDNAADANLVLYFLKSHGLDNSVHWMKDGAEVLRYFTASEQPAQTLPKVVLLDLNLPKVDGREVLQKMKCNQSAKHVPVFVLTTSSREEDSSKTTELGAAGYFIKPSTLTEFEKLIQHLVSVEFPRLGIKKGPARYE